MAKFFVNRPIVAIVISIIIVIVGIVAILGLPIAQYPDIVPPEIYINTTYVGADAQTVEQSVATPIEQEMSGVDNMNYMYSLNANNGELKLYVNFDVKTDPNIDQVLTQMRKAQADSKLPAEVRDYGVTVKKSTSSPLMLVALSSPDGSYDATFLANYAYINLNDQLTRVPGIASVTVFGAGQYAMRLWVKPDQLAKLNITVPEIVDAIKKQNTVNPAGQVGGEPVPAGQEFTYAIRAQGRLEDPEEFAQIVLRANPDGSLVRLKDVARIELGSQTYAMSGRLNGKAAAVLALYQLPGSNAIAAVDGVTRLMEEVKKNFPSDLEYSIPLDTTQSVREGIKEILKTLYRGAGPGDHRGVHLPAGLARHPDPGAGGAGLADRHLRHVPAAGVLHQHDRADGAGARHRARGGRRHRGGGGGGAPHRARALAQGGDAQGHGGGLRAGRRHRAGALRGVPADGFHPRHHGQALPAVCGHHRHLGHHLGLQRPDPEPGPVLPDPEAQEKDPRPSGGVLPRVQQRLRQGHQRLRDGSAGGSSARSSSACSCSF